MKKEIALTILAFFLFAHPCFGCISEKPSVAVWASQGTLASVEGLGTFGVEKSIMDTVCSGRLGLVEPRPLFLDRLAREGIFGVADIPKVFKDREGRCLLCA